MATKGKKTTNEMSSAEEVGQIVSRSEQFIERNKKGIVIGVILVILVVGAILGYRYGIAAPKEKKAAAELFEGEFYFQQDSFQLALKGDGKNFIGFDQIIDKYGSTKSGNLAKAYAGICNYRLGNSKEAIALLNAYKGKDNMIAPSIVGLIGDCYVAEGNVEKAITYFEKAASQAKNEVISPLYLMKAGRAYESLNRPADALKVYKEIKEKYYTSLEAQDIDKYILRAEGMIKK